MSSETVIDAIGQAIRGAGRYNRDDKVQPVAVLWPDPDRLWEAVVPQLRDSLPLVTLGEYDPDRQLGPALWIRTVVDSAGADKPTDAPWVVYLPGVDRGEIRAIESCSSGVRPIAELQFRSTWWLQSNQAPWTPGAFLRSGEGLALDVARDAATRDALSLALGELAGASVEDLRRRGRIEAEYLTSLLSSDEVKTLLDGLNDPEGTRSRLRDNEWAAFLTQCKATFSIDPVSAGPVLVAERLGSREGAWAKVWKRFAEAPHSYPNIPGHLRQARPAQLFIEQLDSWPQDNEAAEQVLRSTLDALATPPPAEVRQRIAELEAEHANRRDSVWGQLGQSPLADALEHLARLAVRTQSLPSEVSTAAFARWYSDQGWPVDAAAIDALAVVPDPVLRDSVGGVLRAIYLPWLDGTARRFQDAAVSEDRIGDTGLEIDGGDCVLFVDGLRLDVAQRLRADLSTRGADVELAVRLAPFPTMTSSGKPAVAPLDIELAGGQEMGVTAAGKAVDAPYLRDLLLQAGVSAIAEGDIGDPSGRGWTETGDLDSTGHKLGLKLVDRIPAEVAAIASRVQELLGAGWSRVHVVTDHGWLLMPGTLPKVELPQHLTTSRKSRCARLTSRAGDVDQPTAAWTWDPGVRMASPRGVAAFTAGCIYEHGGLSPQESIIPHLVVSRSATTSPARIEQVKWIGMRCRVDVVDAPEGSAVDLRHHPGEASSSFVAEAKFLEGETDAKLLVEDDGLLGEVAYVVLLSDLGDILAQVSTRVGG